MLKDNEKYNKNVKSNSSFMEELFNKLPEFFTSEKYDDKGNLIESAKFNLDKFEHALKEYNVGELSSGYQLNFIGKNYAKKQSGEIPKSVIVPDKDHNTKPININSKNLFFTGDNLELLRYLQSNYAKSIDFIYIDPPYNTNSNDFVYPDNFDYSDDQLKDMFELSDEELKRLKSIQGRSTHDAWLTFMYPRLYLAKKLLKDEGVIFVSIDDNEQANLKILMDEIFGEGSFTVQFIWAKTSTPPALSNKSRSTTEYILVYEKNISSKKYFGSLLDNGSVSLLNASNKKREVVIPAKSANFGFIENGTIPPSKFDRIELLDEVNIKNGINENEFRVFAQIRWTQKKINDEVKNGTYFTFNTKNMNPRYQRSQSERFKTPNTALYKELDIGTNEEAVKHLSKLGFDKIFDYPKPVSLVKYLINMITFDNPEAIIFDFFAGSGTTAEAVMQLNAEDEGNRKFIMCTLPEKTYFINSKGDEVATNGGMAAYREGYKSIDEISRNRIIRASENIRQEYTNENMDLGFQHFNIVSPSQESLEEMVLDGDIQLDIFDNMIDKFSSESLGLQSNSSGFETILTTYLVRDNYRFDVPIEMKNFDGITVPYINNQRIYIITDKWKTKNTKALINAIGKYEISVQTIVIYGYTIEMEILRELEIALNQLENKVIIQVRY
ncbi:site-specific DNA-methyltransferase [Staphylococcus hominis]|uniref:site-specific DNA-methyltransferase n=1 Tax=Staphylococcus hominis TaxID=1290 RepID=UPI00320467EF